MHKCTNCGTEFEGKFCPECGTKRQEKTFCPECGAELSMTAKFCPECGYKISEQSAPKNADLGSDRTDERVKREEQSGDGYSDQNIGRRSYEGEKPERYYGERADRYASDRFEREDDHNNYYREQRPKPQSQYGILNDNIILILFKCLRFLPEILFMTFGVLVFAFMAGPVAATKGGSFMGEKIPSQSLGSGYKFIGGGELSSLQGSAIALLIFSVIALGLAGTIAYTWYKDKESLCIKLTYVGIGTYLVFLILGSVMAGLVAKEDGGIGLIKVGACPVCLIVFSILFMLFSIGSIVGCRFLGSKSVVLNYLKDLSKKKAQKAEAIRERQRNASYDIGSASYQARSINNDGYTVKLNKRSQLYDKLMTLISLRRISIVMGISTVIYLTMFYLFTFVKIGGSIYKTANLFLGFTYILFAFIVVGIVLAAAMKPKTYSVEKIRTKVWNVLSLISGILTLASFIFLFITFITGMIEEIRFIPLVAVETLSSVYGSIYKIATIALAFIGGLCTMIVSDFSLTRSRKLMDDIIGGDGEFTEAAKSLFGEMIDKSAKEINKLCFANKQLIKGKEYTAKTPYIVVYLAVKKVSLILAIGIIAALSITLPIVASTSTDIFTGSAVECFVGGAVNYPEEFFGTPDFKSENNLIYYDGAYKSVIKKLNKNSLEQEKAIENENLTELDKLMEAEEKLLQQLESMTTKCLSIKIRMADENEYYDYYVYEAVLDAHYNEDDIERQVKDIYYIYSDRNDVMALIYYNDGSVRYESTGKSGEDVKENKVITWSDEWGEYEINVSHKSNRIKSSNDIIKF